MDFLQKKKKKKNYWHFFFDFSFGHTDPNYEEFSLANSYVATFRGMILLGWNSTPSKISSRIAFFMCVSIISYS